MHAPPPSMVLHSSLRCLHIIPSTIRSFPANNSSDIMQDRTLRWRVFVAVAVDIWDIVATSCRDRRGWRGSAQRDGGSPGRAEGGVGGTVSGDGRWSLAWIPEPEASSVQV